ncbi:MAG: hypothetical protein FWE62_07000, partial [Firmicutes bacterium]|nr:hypothetical protein [Bacillota bacterium]
MIKSMTGYGRAVDNLGGRRITVEMRSVNHRFFDFSARAPRIFGFLEDALRKSAQGFISRGKVDAAVFIENEQAADFVVTLNRPAVEAYIGIVKTLSVDYGLKADVSAGDMMRLPETLSSSRAEVDADALTADVLSVMAAAAAQFNDMRAAEGRSLAADIINRAQAIGDAVAQVEKRSPDSVMEYKTKLEERIKELCGGYEPDEARIVTEAALYADRIAVAEET